MPEFIQDILSDGNMTHLIIAAVIVVGGLFVERLLLGIGLRAYFRVGMPLGAELVPVPLAPRGEGRTATVRWKVDADGGSVRFWSQPGDRTAPMGLHGVVGLVRTPRGIQLPVRWSPPFTPFLALVWFAGLGVFRGQGLITVPIAVLIMAAAILLYRQSALRAAKELRWAFVSGERGPGPEDPPPVA